jgi:molybdopterin molybdotransferase
MKEVWSVEEAFNAINDNFCNAKVNITKLKLLDSIGSTLSNPIISTENVPSFNRSTVDGYAVISQDTFGASETMPTRLKNIGEVKMGSNENIKINPDETVYIPTGGRLPQNCDGVVMVEYTENCDDGYIYIEKSCAPGNNIIFSGDDIKEGEIVLAKGTKLGTQDIGALAALGFSEVDVYDKVKVGIISTGDELVDINSKISGSNIRDINSYSLYSSIVTHGGKPHIYGIVHDDFDSIFNMAKKALAENDIVLISGGSSVGTKDETFNVINALGKPGVFVHKIAVKPGKPTIIGKVGEKAVVGLPGHPGSAYVIFNIFVKRIIDCMYGVAVNNNSTPTFYAKMSTNYSSNTGREEFLPVILKNEGTDIIAEPVNSKSGLITQFIKANAYIRIPRLCEGLNSGDIVEVHRF